MNKNAGNFCRHFSPEITVWFLIRYPYNALRIATVDNLK